MKRPRLAIAAFLGLLTAAGFYAVYGQQPPSAPPQQQQQSQPNEAQQRIQHEANELALQAALLAEKMHGITEFQQYQDIQRQIQLKQQEFYAAGTRPGAASTTPAKPTPAQLGPQPPATPPAKK